MTRKQVKVAQRNDILFFSGSCGLCRRRSYSPRLSCNNCALTKANYRCGDYKSTYAKALRALGYEDETEWRQCANDVFILLMTMVSEPIVLKDICIAKEEQTCKIGDRFNGPDGEYILTAAEFGTSPACSVILIHLGDGIRWQDAKIVKCDGDRIHVSEIHRVFDCRFELIEKEYKDD